MATIDKTIDITTREMHTGGEPLRIVERGYPPILGDTILEQRAYVRANLDHLRRLVLEEPRGHGDIYGALLVPVTHPDAHLAVLFMDGHGYSTMCGHAVIALCRYAIDTGIVKEPQSPETEVRIQCPCGLVTAYTEYDAVTKTTGATRFQSVPSYAFKLQHPITLADGREVSVDVGFGGAFYAIVPGERVGVNVATSPIPDIIRAAADVKSALLSTLTLHHPLGPEVAFLYGVILTDGEDTATNTPASLVVFADKQVDRCPCGSGSCARIAVLQARGLVAPNQPRSLRNAKTHSAFSVTIIKVLAGEGQGQGKGEGKGTDDAVVVEVKGNAFYTGRSTFTAEEKDPLRGGFRFE